MQTSCDNDRPQDSRSKSTLWYESVREAWRKEADPEIVFVGITSYRRSLLDGDFAPCGKYPVDCLRYARLIRGDTEKEICYYVRQIKVVSKDEERTEIEIIYPAGYSLVNQRLFL